MATGGLDSFLRAEEEANRLLEELRRLKEETESYKTAREALGQAAVGVSDLSTRCARMAEQLGGVAETLRSIGTPELLRGLEGMASELGMLRQDLDSTRQSITEALAQVMAQVLAQRETLQAAERDHQEGLQRMHQAMNALATAESVSAVRQELEQRHEAHRQELVAVQENLGAQVAGAKAVVTTVRNLALGSIGLSLIALALLGWLVVTLARG